MCSTPGRRRRFPPTPSWMSIATRRIWQPSRLTGYVISPLNLSGIDRQFQQRHDVHLDGGPGAQVRQPHCRRQLCGNGGEKLPRYSFPNAFPGASPGFAPHTEFDSEGNVIGGFGVENVIIGNSHSTYHALQTSLSGTSRTAVPASRPVIHGVSRSMIRASCFPAPARPAR